MYKQLAIFVMIAFMIGYAGTASAHKMDVVGDTKIEIGWKDEPPIMGLDNEITITTSKATDFDKSEAMKMRQAMAGMPGMNTDSSGQDNMGGMDMTKSDDYDSTIGPILGQFEDGKVSAGTALNQISDIITKDNPQDQFGKEIKYLVNDANSGKIPVDDALYNMISMIGTGVQTDMNMPGMNTDSSGQDNMGGMDMGTMQHMQGQPITSGILKGFTGDVMLGNNDIPLNFVEDSKYPGIYHAKIVPPVTGYPMVHISGNLAGESADITFHPEKVEPLNILRPLQQVERGINPEDVQCKEGFNLYMRIADESALCLSTDGGDTLMQMGLVGYY